MYTCTKSIDMHTESVGVCNNEIVYAGSGEKDYEWTFIFLWESLVRAGTANSAWLHWASMFNGCTLTQGQPLT